MKAIADDKKAHFCAGWAIAATALMFVNVWLSILLVAVAGAAKELFDKVTGPTGRRDAVRRAGVGRPPA